MEALLLLVQSSPISPMNNRGDLCEHLHQRAISAAAVGRTCVVGVINNLGTRLRQNTKDAYSGRHLLNSLCNGIKIKTKHVLYGLKCQRRVVDDNAPRPASSTGRDRPEAATIVAVGRPFSSSNLLCAHDVSILSCKQRRQGEQTLR